MYDPPDLDPAGVALNWQYAMTVSDLTKELEKMPDDAKIIISIRPKKYQQQAAFYNARPLRVILAPAPQGYKAVYITD